MGEADSVGWNIEIAPNIHLRKGDIPSAVGTATQIVSCIPNTINAEPEFVTLDKLPTIRYRDYSLHVYLDNGNGQRGIVL